jgi:hypothetical protein
MGELDALLIDEPDDEDEGWGTATMTDRGRILLTFVGPHGDEAHLELDEQASRKFVGCFQDGLDSDEDD